MFCAVLTDMADDDGDIRRVSRSCLLDINVRESKLWDSCIIRPRESRGVFGPRRRPKEKDNETFAKGVSTAVRVGGHVRLGSRPQSSRSGRWTDSGMPTKTRLELLATLQGIRSNKLR